MAATGACFSQEMKEVKEEGAKEEGVKEEIKDARDASMREGMLDSAGWAHKGISRLGGSQPCP